MRNLLNAFLILMVATFSMSSCDDGTDGYDIPATYNFENVSYAGQTQRLSMLAELAAYAKSGSTAGTIVTADKLKGMYSNDPNNADFANTYDATKQLKNKTFSSETAVFEGLMDDLATASQSTMPASDGQAGISTSADNEKNYLLNANGLELAQVIEKGIMGACLYYQATSVYFGPDKMNGDNETVEPGEGTAMEHHWDEAFGYLGVPVDFPTSTDGIVFWGKYSNTVNGVLSTNQGLMDAFLKGRAAISNKDLPARDEAIVEARAEWEEIVAGSAIHYLNSALANTGDFTRRAHALSEALAFIYSLNFNLEKSLTNTQIDELLTTIGGSADFNNINLYNTTDANITAVKNQLATYLSWDEATANAL